MLLQAFIFYDNSVVDLALEIKPSSRGEYEITDLNRLYLEQNRLRVDLLGRGYAWLDTGEHDALLEAGQFVQTIEHRQGIKVACLEEIALNNGWLSIDTVHSIGKLLNKTNYGQYLLGLGI